METYAFDPRMNPIAPAVAQTVAWLRVNTSPSNTLAVLPEGVMIDYLARRENATPYVGFTLLEVEAYGETNMIQAYVRHRPDYILLFHRDSSEYGSVTSGWKAVTVRP